jgi:hypothetical protein
MAFPSQVIEIVSFSSALFRSSKHLITSYHANDEHEGVPYRLILALLSQQARHAP